MLEFDLVPGPRLGELKSYLLEGYRNEEVLPAGGD